METARTSLRSLAAEKGLEFTADVEPDMPLAYGDGKRITQCLTNLVGNALKFTKQGRVAIHARREGDEVIYSVADTGIGIPADQLDQIFGEFRQVDASISREFGGTGLGLSITKTLRRAPRRAASGSRRARPRLDVPLRDTPAGGRGHGGRMSQKRILLIEDNEFNRKIVRDLLARQPYDLAGGQRRRGGGGGGPARPARL